MKKVLVSFSGGADSTTLLYTCMDSFDKENVRPVYFNYGQRHYPGEIKAVESICHKEDLDPKIFHFDLAQFGRSPLTNPNIKVPAQSEKNQAITVVPYRNSFFILHMAAFAVVEGYDVLALGSTFEDLAEYPDCRPEFFDQMQTVLRLGDKHHHIELYTPYVDVPKKEVIAEGLMLHVPYSLTHTCYEGRYQDPCRVCDACKEREASFEANGEQDPLLWKYEEGDK